MEIISPWALYWILQLDSIKTLFWVLGSVLLVSVIFGCVAAVEEVFDMDDPDSKIVRKLFAGLGSFGLFLVVANAFMPSTKNVAAIVVIPAIANSKAVQNEASEIYQLAKQAMQKAVDYKKEPEPQQETTD